MFPDTEPLGPFESVVEALVDVFSEDQFIEENNYEAVGATGEEIDEPWGEVERRERAWDECWEQRRQQSPAVR